MRNRVAVIAIAIVALVVLFAVIRPSNEEMPENIPSLIIDESKATEDAASGLQLATFGTGCFWCTEAVFQQLKGVTKVVSGYSGGTLKNPSYEDICTGSTGHAEVIQITYDPKIVTYPQLLEVFWRSHNPTTKNRQGRDVGTQYRSVIFYHNPRQKELAEQYRQLLDNAEVFPNPIVTEITPFSEFYPAEAMHQNFYAGNSQRSYCRNVITPKLDKLRKVFETINKE